MTGRKPLVLRRLGCRFPPACMPARKKLNRPGRLRGPRERSPEKKPDKAKASANGKCGVSHRIPFVGIRKECVKLGSAEEPTRTAYQKVLDSLEWVLGRGILGHFNHFPQDILQHSFESRENEAGSSSRKANMLKSRNVLEWQRDTRYGLAIKRVTRGAKKEAK